MIIFIDGFQNTGKTTLVNNCKYKHNRFPFNQYLDKLEIDDLNGYQLGKDLGICFSSSFIKDNIVLDRGPLSTVFYSLKENRYGEKTVEKMVQFLSEIRLFKNCKFVWIKKVNAEDQPSRVHEDGFDYLDDDNDPKKDEIFDLLIKICDYVGINVHIFENDFSKKLKQNYHSFNDLLEDLFNEYNRD